MHATEMQGVTGLCNGAWVACFAPMLQEGISLLASWAKWFVIGFGANSVPVCVDYTRTAPEWQGQNGNWGVLPKSL